MARAFRQLGHAYGPSPTIITVAIDGTQIFSGPVPTTDVAPPGHVRPHNPQEPCFSWSVADASWTGTMNLEIQNSGPGIFQICETQAIGNVDATEPEWGEIWSEIITTPAGNIVLGDPLTDVTLNGVSQSKGDIDDLYGQWVWNIPSGATFAATINVNVSGQQTLQE